MGEYGGKSRTGQWFQSLRDEMDSVLSRFVGEDSGLSASGFQPSVDVVEQGNVLIVSVDLPGFTSDDVHLEVHGDVLTLRGEVPEGPAEDSGGEDVTVHRLERRRAGFRRSVTLPCNIVAEHAEASFEHGVLTIRLPKADESKSQRIHIRHT